MVKKYKKIIALLADKMNILIIKLHKSLHFKQNKNIKFVIKEKHNK